MSSESLFSELLVASILDGVDLESVRVAVDVMVLGKEIRDWVESETNEQSHGEDNLGVWDL
jgi:hypothetical protein